MDILLRFFCYLLLHFSFFLFKQCCIEILFPEAHSSLSYCREHAETLYSSPNVIMKPLSHKEHQTKYNA